MRFNYWLLLISLTVLTIFIILLFCLKKKELELCSYGYIHEYIVCYAT